VENINDPETFSGVGRGYGRRRDVLGFEQPCAKPSNRDVGPAPWDQTSFGPKR